MPARVVAIAYDGLAPIELAIAIEVFGTPRPELRDDWYAFTVCAERPGALRAIGGLELRVAAGLEALTDADTVVIPGCTPPFAPAPFEIVRALRAAHARGARIVALCTGTFTLAATGLLDGRPATTHWRHAPQLKQMYPRVLLDPDVLYVDDGDVLTSAGSAAGLDLCIHVVRRDYGSALANALARRLVIAPHRAGGQAQFIERPVSVGSVNDPITATQAWARDRLSTRLSVGDMARHACLSYRHFSRRFVETVGISPAQWLVHERLEASLPLLEDTSMSIEAIAAAVGFADAASFRSHFRRLRGISPTAHRQSFALSAPVSTRMTGSPSGTYHFGALKPA